MEIRGSGQQLNVTSSRPTMKDVAARARVGLKTVSRVVNGEPNVSPETEQLVRAAIRDLGFRRNDSAAMLRQGLSSSIGLVLDDISEPFQSTLTQAIERAALRAGSVLFVGSSAADEDHEKSVLLAFCARRVDGLILVPGQGEHSYLLPEMRAGIKVVCVDRPAVGIDADTVLSENVGGARLGTLHLASHGHRRIGFIGDRPEIFTAKERFLGYRSALSDYGLPFDERLVSMAGVDDDAVRAGLHKLLDGPGPATALFTGNGLITMSVLRTLRGASLRPAVVGHDDMQLFDLLDPGITVVAQDPASIGTQAAELLFRRLKGDDAPNLQIRVATRLICRGSGETPPAA